VLEENGVVEEDVDGRGYLRRLRLCGMAKTGSLRSFLVRTGATSSPCSVCDVSCVEIEGFRGFGLLMEASWSMVGCVLHFVYLIQDFILSVLLISTMLSVSSISTYI